MSTFFALLESKYTIPNLKASFYSHSLKTKTMQKGQISVQTENIFPIIKQFLYSDQEIFLRELISNAVDATSKVKTLSSNEVFNLSLIHI